MMGTGVETETEIMQMKKQIDHAMSLSTLGQLAASIAHEIRNPLTSLMGFTQLLSHEVTAEGNMYLGIIHSELIRMESILNEFLVLSKPSIRSYNVIPASSIITELVEFMNPQAIIQNIGIVVALSDRESDCILCDAYEMKKVLMNILKNAMEVMPDGGKITINQSLDENGRVRISISDQGCGMTQEQAKNIFVPFYTSKTQGTGLGLSHAIRVVEEHGGCMEVESEVGVGTTFHLFLPLCIGDQMKEHPTYAQSHAKSQREAISSKI